jgi:hypothetical protein
MSISFRNTINTGIHGPSTGQNPLEACLPQTPSPFWAGVQPFGHIAGIQDEQGSFGKHKWQIADWVSTAVGGAGTAGVEIAATHPSTFKIISRATQDLDGYNMQWSKDGGTTVSDPFVLAAGQLQLAYFRIKVDNASTDAHTKADIFVGLSSSDTGILASDADVVGFLKASGAATMVGTIAASGTATDTSALANSVVDNTYITLGLRFNGITSVEFWQGTTPFDMTLSATQTTMTNKPVLGMALSMAFNTSEASAIDFYAQHAYAMQEAI